MRGSRVASRKARVASTPQVTTRGKHAASPELQAEERISALEIEAAKLREEGVAHSEAAAREKRAGDAARVAAAEAEARAAAAVSALTAEPQLACRV